MSGYLLLPFSSRCRPPAPRVCTPVVDLVDVVSSPEEPLGLVACPTCGGEGGREVSDGRAWDGAEDGHVEYCPECEGAGELLELVAPITLEDLEDRDADAPLDEAGLTADGAIA